MAAIVQAKPKTLAWPERRPVPAHPRPELRVIEGGRQPSAPVTSAVYLRRRVAVVAVAILVVLAAFAAVARAGVGPLAAPAVATPAPSATGAPAAAATAAGAYVVQPGDTWWTIARRLQPSGDVRPLVDRLVARHRGAALQVGEVVSVARR